MIKRRVGPDPHLDGPSPNLDNCPDVFELDDGDFAIIGRRVTKELKSHLPNDASCGSDEEIVILPRKVFMNAAKDVHQK